MIQKDGHMDVASSKRMCKAIIEDAQEILDGLPSGEVSLPTWWTNKLAKCSAYMNGARDYLVFMESPTAVEQTSDQDGQVTVGNYQTKHFDICPSAQELYKDIEATDTAIESAMLHDMLFMIEKQAIANNSATDSMVDKAQHYADMIMQLAKEMGMEEDHSYVEDDHMAKIKELAETDSDDQMMTITFDYDDMLPPSAKMVKEMEDATEEGQESEDSI